MEVTLLPTIDLDKHGRKDLEPISIGSLELYDNKLVGLISVPMDALPPILQMLIADRLKFIAISGTQLYRRTTRLNGLRPEMNMEEEDGAEE